MRQSLERVGIGTGLMIIALYVGTTWLFFRVLKVCSHENEGDE